LGAPIEADGPGIAPWDLAPLMTTVGKNLAPGPLAEMLLLPAVFALADADGLALVDGGATPAWAAHVGVVRQATDRIRGEVALVQRPATITGLVVVVEGPEEGDSPCLVARIPYPQSGVSVDEVVSADPTARLCTISIDVAEADVEVLAAGADAARMVQDLRSWRRVLAACEMTGIAERVLADSLDYAQVRHQFGRAIGSFQAVKHILAEMAQKSMSLSALCQLTLHRAPEAGPDERELAALTVYAHACEVVRFVTEGGLQVHGGIGFTEELDLQLFIKRAYALSVTLGGAAETLSEIGSRRLFAREAVC
jgi:alkylation response protein AidB-like acyl-CoA dehydrogenase